VWFNNQAALGRHSEFVKLADRRGARAWVPLWIGLTISQIGSQVTLLARPLTAVLLLHATPGRMGLLYAAETGAPSWWWASRRGSG